MEVIGVPALSPEKIARLTKALSDVIDDSTTVRILTDALSTGKKLAITDTYISTGKAAELIGVSRPFVCHLMDAGLLKFHWTGKKRRTTLTDVQDYLRRRDAATSTYVSEVTNRETRMADIAAQATTYTEDELHEMNSL